MVSITKDEAMELRKRFKDNCHIVRFCKKKSKRHHYCTEESDRVLQVLSELRGEPVDVSVN